jgi:large subunit ribosomal protein L5
MREIRIEKVTLNIGAGKDQKRLDNAVKLLKNITGIDPIKTVTQKRIAGWGLRPGLPIGCKITLRNNKASEILSRVLDAKDNNLKPKNFDDNGNLAFGIHEYIDIKDAKYDPDIGMMGLEVSVTLERPGFRIRKRRINRKKIPVCHKIGKDDAISFMQKNFNTTIEDE